MEKVSTGLSQSILLKILPLDLRILKTVGVISAYASPANRSPELPFYQLMRLNAAIEGVLLFNAPIEVRKLAQKDINDWLEMGKAVHRIAAGFPLERTAGDHLYVEEGGMLGTVIVAL